MSFPTIKSVSYVLAHVPDLVRYGSKPQREIARQGSELYLKLRSALRSYERARDYPPHQAFIGNLDPDMLWRLELPWWKNLLAGAERIGRYGEIVPQDEFYGIMKICDEAGLLCLERSFASEVKEKLSRHDLTSRSDLERLNSEHSLERIERRMRGEGALPLFNGERLVGCIGRGHEEDETLSPPVLLENLACKASGVLAMRWALRLAEPVVGPEDISYVLNTGEEAVGDRYQRGAGNLAKAMAESCGCINSTGADVKAFCCGPLHGLVIAAGLVSAGVFEKIMVVGGGSLAKLGMKFQGHLSNQMPILEDVLASFAVLVGPPDGRNPEIRLDAIGKHDVRYSSAAQSVAEALVVKPLEKLNKRMLDIDKFSVELHNPEITEPAGSANVPRNNYRTIAGLAAMRGEMERSRMADFERERGLPGFSPTQGHVASAVPFLGHARDKMLKGEMSAAMFIAKGSLFLGKMTNLSDGISFVLQAQRR